MPKFVIHKKAFFYTDESFEWATETKGSITNTFSTLEEANIEKGNLEIKSVQKLAGMNAVDFFFSNPKYEEIYSTLNDYYQSEFNIQIKDKYFFNFPKKIDEQQAAFFKDAMELSFHDIVEYADDVELDPEDFNLENEELGMF